MNFEKTKVLICHDKIYVFSISKCFLAKTVHKCMYVSKYDAVKI